MSTYSPDKAEFELGKLHTVLGERHGLLLRSGETSSPIISRTIDSQYWLASQILEDLIDDLNPLQGLLLSIGDSALRGRISSEPLAMVNLAPHIYLCLMRSETVEVDPPKASSSEAPQHRMYFGNEVMVELGDIGKTLANHGDLEIAIAPLGVLFDRSHINPGSPAGAPAGGNS